MRAIGMAHPLDAFDIFEIAELADERRYPHTLYVVLRALFDSPDFDYATYKDQDHPLLQRPSPIHQLLFGKEHITLQLIDHWLHQLGRDTPEWQQKLGEEALMAWVGDQLTMDRLRNLFRFRAEDGNSFERLDWMVLSPGWLHIQMAFANSIHKQHLGTAKGRGLSAAFDVLERKGLQSSHTQGPFFHDLSECLHIIADAQLREVWLEAAKVKSLADLRTKTPQELHALAEQIISHHASSEALTRLKQRNISDDIKSQSIMFLRDVIPFILLRAAVRTGDVGIMEDMIPLMLYRFIGGRNSNYAGEMLELLQGLHREWPPEVCEFVRENCWVINNTGRRTGFMPVDEAQEMNIKDIKVTYRSEGPNIDWQYLQKLHPAIHVIKAVNAHMETEMKTRVRGSSHTVPKKELDTKEMQKWYQASQAQATVNGRVLQRTAKKKSPDIPRDFLAKGSTAIQTGKSLETWIEARSIMRSTSQDWDTLDTSDSDKE
ncbi:hypothetical protein B0H15DRAFT_935959 [Mycena belliarum]|uniref:DUF6589 domain-containing protein n=1 Tax=Mycena belliarum TaxID=1033014 RepID=A0AAD6ULR7_9AGAR|nr:hypothetical protein B0H15DRAFT_935959 [Mycena belliae]